MNDGRIQIVLLLSPLKKYQILLRARKAQVVVHRIDCAKAGSYALRVWRALRCRSQGRLPSPRAVSSKARAHSELGLEI